MNDILYDKHLSKAKIKSQNECIAELLVEAAVLLADEDTLNSYGYKYYNERIDELK